MPFNWNDLYFWRKPSPKFINMPTPRVTAQEPTPQSPAVGAGESKEPSYRDCPVERDVLGRHSWTLLHSMAAHVPENPTKRERKELSHFMKTLSKYYPCQMCADELKNYLETDPPKVETRNDFAQWMCRMHNSVNERLGKPSFDCSKVDERWRNGWKDGSCD